MSNEYDRLFSALQGSSCCRDCVLMSTTSQEISKHKCVGHMAFGSFKKLRHETSDAFRHRNRIQNDCGHEIWFSRSAFRPPIIKPKTCPQAKIASGKMT
eukprot:scaffold2065_cov107-Cylindrotheca_fusiformis.AAC.3